jgi:hypothetical protein
MAEFTTARRVRRLRWNQHILAQKEEGRALSTLFGAFAGEWGAKEGRKRKRKSRRGTEVQEARSATATDKQEDDESIKRAQLARLEERNARRNKRRVRLKLAKRTLGIRTKPWKKGEKPRILVFCGDAGFAHNMKGVSPGPGMKIRKLAERVDGLVNVPVDEYLTSREERWAEN